MSTDARFDEEILKRAEALASELIKHKELRSIAVIVDWDLPDAAANALPAGVWKPQQQLDMFVGTTGMQIQMQKMSHTLGQILINGIKQLHQASQKEQTDNK